MELEYLIPKPKRKSKQIEITHIQNETGWKELHTPDLSECTKVVYLGKCCDDGDMFVAHEDDYILIYKGHLNNGKIPKSYLD